MKTSFKIASLCVNNNELWLLEWLKQRAKLEGVSVSMLIRQAVKEYIERHKDPNPQTLLLQDKSQNSEFHNLPREQRKTMMEEFLQFYECSPQKSPMQCMAQFAKTKGLTHKTMMDYIDILREARLLKKR